MKILKCSKNEPIDFSKSDLSQLIDLLEAMKKKEPDIKYAYAYE